MLTLYFSILQFPTNAEGLDMLYLHLGKTIFSQHGWHKLRGFGYVIFAVWYITVYSKECHLHIIKDIYETLKKS